MLVAGVLLENCPAAEDTGRIVFDSRAGNCAVLFPQGGGRARAYFCYHKGSRRAFKAMPVSLISSKARSGQALIQAGMTERRRPAPWPVLTEPIQIQSIRFTMGLRW